MRDDITRLASQLTSAHTEYRTKIEVLSKENAQLRAQLAVRVCFYEFV